jgi:hypothetical protein
MGRKSWEDRRIINTKYYAEYQRMVSEAGLFAVRDAKERGLPITYVENDQIIKEYSDGRKEVLGAAKPWVPVEKKVFILPGQK